MHRWLRERLRGARGSNFAERNNKWPSEPRATSDRQRALPVTGSHPVFQQSARVSPRALVPVEKTPSAEGASDGVARNRV